VKPLGIVGDMERQCIYLVLHVGLNYGRLLEIVKEIMPNFIYVLISPESEFVKRKDYILSILKDFGFKTSDISDAEISRWSKFLTYMSEQKWQIWEEQLKPRLALFEDRIKGPLPIVSESSFQSAKALFDLLKEIPEDAVIYLDTSSAPEAFRSAARAVASMEERKVYLTYRDSYAITDVDIASSRYGDKYRSDIGIKTRYLPYPRIGSTVSCEPRKLIVQALSTRDDGFDSIGTLLKEVGSFQPSMWRGKNPRVKLRRHLNVLEKLGIVRVGNGRAFTKSVRLTDFGKMIAPRMIK